VDPAHDRLATHEPDHHRTRSPALLRRLALLTVLGSVVAFVVVWYVFIRTNDGRRFENFVWDSRRVMAPGIRRTQNDALNLVTEVTLGLGLLVILLLGVVRRTWVVAFVTCAGIGGATVSTQILKRIVIDRPPTIGELARISANSFPSGHATWFATASLLLADLLPERRERLLPVGLQGGYVRAYCALHYPSDVLASQRLAEAISQEVIASPQWRTFKQQVAEERSRLLVPPPAGVPLLSD
jgi:membrane-associated phospholipid phosphatase